MKYTLTSLWMTGNLNDFTVRPFQRKILKAVESGSEIGITMPRGNGKSTFASAIALSRVMLEENREVVVVSGSYGQSRSVMKQCRALIPNEHDHKEWRFRDSPNEQSIRNLSTGGLIRSISSKPNRAHGLIPDLILADEPAQWQASDADKMHEILKTTLGKNDCKLIVFGTRPTNRDHFFSRMLDDSLVEVIDFGAPLNADPLCESTWKSANPLWRFAPNLRKQIRREAEQARNDPQALAAFKQLRLNQGTEFHIDNLVCTAEAWSELEREDVEIGNGYILGVDLGSGSAMSAVAAYDTRTSGLDALAMFGNKPTLTERSMKDGSDGAYERMVKRGELVVSDSAVPDPSDLLRLAIERWGTPRAIVSDRWRIAEIRDAVRKHKLRSELISRGMGYRDGSSDLRVFRNAILDGRLRVQSSLLLSYAVGGARLIIDPAGNAKLGKNAQGGRRARHKDDALSAAILAVAVGERSKNKRAKFRVIDRVAAI